MYIQLKMQIFNVSTFFNIKIQQLVKTAKIKEWPTSVMKNRANF